MNVIWHLLVDLPRYVVDRWFKQSTDVLDLSGYKLVPPSKSVQKYEGVEAEARKDMLNARESEKNVGTMAKLEALRGDIARVEALQRSHSENIGGLSKAITDDVSSLNDKMAAILRALDNHERADLAVARRSKVAPG